jgi:Zn-dependent M28 family amino/carboxypeptidase
MTYYGRWTYKYEEAARQGAVGFLIVHETAPASYGWNTVKNSNTNVMFDIVRKESEARRTPWSRPGSSATPPSTCSRRPGLDFEALKKQPRPATSSRWN